MAIEKLKYLVTADTKGFAGPIKAIGALAVTAFVAAVKVTADFEKELSKLRAVSGANAQQMASLEKEARRLGATTAFTATEVASLQSELAKLGFTTNDILNSSGGVLDLAAGLGVELADAAVLTGSTLRSFGLTTEETGRVVDVLAKSASSSALDFSKLTESLKDSAPIASAFGFEIEEIVGLLGTLANRGIIGSKAGNSLKRIFVELKDEGLTLAEGLDKVRNSSDKAGVAFDLVGKIAGPAFLALANSGTEADDLAESLRNSAGAAEEMRMIMEDNLIGDFDKLKSAVTELGLKLGQTSDGPLRGMIQEFTRFTTIISNWSKLAPLAWEKTTLKFEYSFLKLMVKLEESFKKFLNFFIKNWNKIADPIERLTGKDASIGLLDTTDAQGSLDELRKKLKKVQDDYRLLYFTLVNGFDPEAAANLPGTVPDDDDDDDPTDNSKKGSRRVGYSHNFGNVRARDVGSTAREDANKEAVKKYEAYVKTVTDKNELLTDSFGKLGQNIASSLGATEGVFGAFIGTLVQGLLELAAQMITSAATTTATSATKVAAYSTEATAAAVAGAAKSAAAAGPAAIGVLPVFIGAALAAVASAFSGLKGSKAKSGGGGSSASSAASTASTPDLRSIQSGGSKSRNVGGLSTRDGNIVISSDLLRQAMEASDDQYPAFS
ncbi:MAG: phage tail tape measure protein [Gammaproteobacteria bacterium]|nr:phage tail tape measure protein [Gammaproteobacteria bacterium]